MKIPKEVKIMGFVWPVKFDKHVSNEGQAFGSTHLHSQVIFLDPSTTVQKNEHTFIHEIMHAVFWQTGLTRRIDNIKLEEEIVNALSFGVYHVLKDNSLLK